MNGPNEQPSEQTVRLRVICLNPPPDDRASEPLSFGLQDKAGALHPGIEQPDGSISFDLTLQAVWNPKTNGPRFRGPFSHGTAEAPFLYLSLKPAIDGAPWLKRLKVTLAPITWAQLEVAARPGARLEARVDGSRAASVPLLDGGWLVQGG
jgi:hypothetical protein